jgi:diphthamide biosynthesis protein 2
LTRLLIGRTDALPVHYVFPRMKLDIEHALDDLTIVSKEELESHSEDGHSHAASGKKRGIIVVWDVAFDWLAGKSLSFLESIAAH